jgi:hypothetical protein
VVLVSFVGIRIVVLLETAIYYFFAIFISYPVSHIAAEAALRGTEAMVRRDETADWATAFVPLELLHVQSRVGVRHSLD